MKSLFVTLIAALSLFLHQQVMAINIIGVEVQIVKGTREWNADKTATLCVGKGICEIIFKGSTPLSLLHTNGTLGRDDRNRLLLRVPSSILNDSQWSDTFVRGKVGIYQDIRISSDIAAKVKDCPNVIKAGQYTYEKVGNDVLIVLP